MEEYPPLAKFSSRFGIIEKTDPVLPVTVRNIEPLIRGKVLEVPRKDGLMDGLKKTGKEVIEKTASLINKVVPGSDQKIEGNISGKIQTADTDEEIIRWLHNLAGAKRNRALLTNDVKAKRFSMPKPLERKTFEVIGIPLKKDRFPRG